MNISCLSATILGIPMNVGLKKAIISLSPRNLPFLCQKGASHTLLRLVLGVVFCYGVSPLHSFYKWKKMGLGMVPSPPCRSIEDHMKHVGHLSTCGQTPHLYKSPSHASCGEDSLSQ